MISEIIRYVILRYYVLIINENIYIYIISTYVLIDKKEISFDIDTIRSIFKPFNIKKIYIHINIVVI